MTIYTGFTGGECELLRIRYASLQRADPGTAYPVPLLCTSNDCNFAAAQAVGGTTCYSSGAARTLGGGGAAVAAAAAVTALAVALAGALL